MSDVNPHVIIIAGANGAGKSTLAPFLLRDTFGLLEYVNADTWVVYDNSGPGNPLLVAAGSHYTIEMIFQQVIWQELDEAHDESGT